MNGGNPGNHILEHLGKAWPPLEDFMKRIHVTKEGYHGGTYEGKATVLSPITSSNCDLCDNISTGFYHLKAHIKNYPSIFAMISLWLCIMSSKASESPHSPGNQLDKIFAKLDALEEVLPPEHLPYLVALRALSSLNKMAAKVILLPMLL